MVDRGYTKAYWEAYFCFPSGGLGFDPREGQNAGNALVKHKLSSSDHCVKMIPTNVRGLVCPCEGCPVSITLRLDEFPARKLS